MPRLWSETIEEHRREVREAILDTTARLATEHGLLNVTMSQIAEGAGIGRPTLYKYFASVEEILQAWHQRQIDHHLQILTETADADGPAHERLANVLQTYAHIQQHRSDHQERHGTEFVRVLHHGDQLVPAKRKLHNLIRDLIADAAASKAIRSDIKADELARYCLHALTAAQESPTRAAADRLVDIILASLQPAR